MLVRKNNTVQVGADSDTRKSQAKEAYAVCGAINANKSYYLLDDIWTTGSSMLAACDEMQKAGVEKLSVVLIAKSG